MKESCIFICQNPQTVLRVYSEEVRNALPANGPIYTKANILEKPEAFREVTCLFSTWGMPSFTEREIEELFPALRAVFYAAGSVQGFAAPFLAKGVKVYSAWQANAIPVAEFTMAQILLGNKGYFRTAATQSVGNLSRSAEIAKGYPGNFGASVGIIGVGMIGRKVLELLRPFSLHVLAFDAFLSEEEIGAYGAEKVSLPELFARCQIVSNHLANNEATRGMIGYDLLARLPSHATFINTGRGAQVREADLIRLLREREDVTALLDVTDPEPPVAKSPFYELPNCFLTPHIAGSTGQEVWRMGEYMQKAYRHWCEGVPSPCEVTAAMLKTMA